MDRLIKALCVALAVADGLLARKDLRRVPEV